jgi:hypothetical protein
VIVAATALAAARARRGGQPGARGALVIALAAATPIGIGLLSLPPDHSFLLPRNMSASLPALAVLVGWLLTALRRPLAVAALALFLGALVCGTAAALDPDNRRAPYRAAAHWVDDRARAGDPVIQHFFLFDAGALGDVLRVNFARPHPLVRGGGPGEAAAWARGRRTGRVFVVLPLPRAFASVEPLDRRSGPGDGFDLVAERRFAGLDDILVGEYRPRSG